MLYVIKHFLPVPNHDRIAVSGHPNDTPWYTGTDNV